jgi:hypothetical protein
MAKWGMFGVQYWPLRAAEPTLFASMTRSLSRISVFTASAMAELLNSISASTPSLTHCRAIDMPTSELLRWSGVSSSNSMSAFDPSSRIACTAHSCDRRPPGWP